MSAIQLQVYGGEIQFPVFIPEDGMNHYNLAEAEAKLFSVAVRASVGQPSLIRVDFWLDDDDIPHTERQEPFCMAGDAPAIANEAGEYEGFILDSPRGKVAANLFELPVGTHEIKVNASTSTGEKVPATIRINVGAANWVLPMDPEPEPQPEPEPTPIKPPFLQYFAIIITRDPRCRGIRPMDFDAMIAEMWTAYRKYEYIPPEPESDTADMATDTTTEGN